jgi:hypothetical protein
MHRSRPVLAVTLLLGALVAAALVLRSGADSANGASTTVASATPYRPDLAQTGATTTGRPPARELDPGLVAAYERARGAAAEAGHDLVINSGYRTPERQQQLLDEEVAKRGSFEEANRWVFTPDRSMHVQGLAIDVGDGGAADWLQEHGAAFGLCHTLSWEWWHFEWRQRWQDAAACPPPAADPSEAPGL